MFHILTTVQRGLRGFLCAFVLCGFVSNASSNEADLADQCVVLLHGLARTAASMEPMQEFLNKTGYQVANIDYASREHPIEVLAEMAVNEGLELCRSQSVEQVHFVTHSLGGILVRQYSAEHEIPELKRVVMLGPPNQGSEVVDRLREVPGFKQINGPAGMQLGTSASDVPANLGPVSFDLGVIAGTRSINPVLSSYLPNPDDGKVSVERAKVEGMSDFLQLPVTHPLMMRDREVMDQVVHFLQQGRFKRD